MKALHIASFNGNIGDIINHIGFWNSFKKFITPSVDVTPLEMRYFYRSWHLKEFNEEFVDYANTFDLIVFGGGNFFDIQWNESKSGVTIDIDPLLLSKIKAPIIFNGIGVDIGKDECNTALDKFEKFLDAAVDKKNCVISVRNDGSIDLLHKYFGDKYENAVIEIPDGGFFTSARSFEHPELPIDKKVIAVNVACDKKDVRWPSQTFTYENFCYFFAKTTEHLLNEYEDMSLVYIPHIPSDINVISDIINKTNDAVRRQKITIAPLLNGYNTSAEYIIDLYKKSFITIGMRYHSNICAISQGTPTIGIVNLDKHICLYNKIGMEERLVSVNSGNFELQLFNAVKKINNNPKKYEDENTLLVKSLSRKNQEYFEMIKNSIKNEGQAAYALTDNSI